MNPTANSEPASFLTGERIHIKSQNLVTVTVLSINILGRSLEKCNNTDYTVLCCVSGSNLCFYAFPLWAEVAFIWLGWKTRRQKLRQGQQAGRSI